MHVLSSASIVADTIRHYLIIQVVLSFCLRPTPPPPNLKQTVQERTADLQRLKARRNELNAKVRMLREELYHLQEPGSYVGEVIKQMGQKKVLVKINPEGKYVVDLEKGLTSTISSPTPASPCAMIPTLCTRSSPPRSIRSSV